MIFGACGRFWGILGLLWANCGVSCCFGIVFPYLGTFSMSSLGLCWHCLGLAPLALACFSHRCLLPLLCFLPLLLLTSPLVFARFPCFCLLPLPLLPPLAFASSPCPCFLPLPLLPPPCFRLLRFLADAPPFFSFPHGFLLSRIIHQQRFPFLALSSSK